jgi:hypothetical protein
MDHFGWLGEQLDLDPARVEACVEDVVLGDG